MMRLGIYTQNVVILQLTQQMASWIHKSGEMKNLYTEMRVFLETANMEITPTQIYGFQLGN